MVRDSSRFLVPLTFPADKESAVKENRAVAALSVATLHLNEWRRLRQQQVDGAEKELYGNAYAVVDLCNSSASHGGANLTQWVTDENERAALVRDAQGIAPIDPL
jgi:hypothetical protein